MSNKGIVKLLWGIIMAKMTVKELKDILERHDDNDIVELFLSCSEFADTWLSIGDEVILDEEVNWLLF